MLLNSDYSLVPELVQQTYYYLYPSNNNANNAATTYYYYPTNSNNNGYSNYNPTTYYYDSEYCSKHSAAVAAALVCDELKAIVVHHSTVSRYLIVSEPGLSATPLKGERFGHFGLLISYEKSFRQIMMPIRGALRAAVQIGKLSTARGISNFTVPLPLGTPVVNQNLEIRIPDDKLLMYIKISTNIKISWRA
ncbi:hypothetical protein TELCIR_03836 [Teladorsagia circumcincta]|uniref:Uncharacterized protein n=1 Tax=Teladorsagia circumcincta TaxID=45464 RepID=A0A2G9UVC2_TELCI|nr:hypothetical protein TELCIR_03836 [Teladorsagia circumcincta]